MKLENFTKREYSPLKEEDFPNLVPGKTVVKWELISTDYGVFTEKTKDGLWINFIGTERRERVSPYTLLKALSVDRSTLKQKKRVKLKDLGL